MPVISRITRLRHPGVLRNFTWPKTPLIYLSVTGVSQIRWQAFVTAFCQC